MARGIPKPYSAQLTNVIVIKQEGSPTMALTATLSELYGAFRRRAGRAAQGMGIADTRFNTTDEKLDALNPTMEQRLNGLSQSFDGLKRELDQRSDALTQAMEQRLEVLSRATDQRLGAFGQTMDQRFDALSQRFDEHGQAFDELKRELHQRSEAFDQAVGQRFVGMEVQLARLETNVAWMLERWTEVIKTPKKLRYLWWTLGILLLALMLGFGAKAIFDWQTPMTFRSLWQN